MSTLGRVFLEHGGPTRKIKVGGKVFTFEMHPYCGPMLLRRDVEPAAYNPPKFLEAVSLWAQQGEKIDADGFCIWYHAPKEILKHLGGRHWKLVGYEEPVKGE